MRRSLRHHAVEVGGLALEDRHEVNDPGASLDRVTQARGIGDVPSGDLALDVVERRRSSRVPNERPHLLSGLRQRAHDVTADEAGGARDEDHAVSSKFRQYLLGVGPRWPWYFDPSPLDPYGCSVGSAICTNDSWPIFISGVDRDRQIRDVRQLERDVAVPARVDEARRRMDEQPEPPQRALALEPRHQVVGQLDPLERRAEHELAGVQDERLAALDLDELGQPFLLPLHVDVRIPRVPEDPKEAIDAHIQAGRLHQGRVVWVDRDPALVDQAPDCSVGKNHVPDPSVGESGVTEPRMRYAR